MIVIIKKSRNIDPNITGFLLVSLSGITRPGSLGIISASDLKSSAPL